MELARLKTAPVAAKSLALLGITIFSVLGPHKVA